MTAWHVRLAPAAALPVILIGVLSVPVRSDDPVASSVTFNREVIRILQRKCLSCHAPGAISMSLSTYREARLWARAIREELIEQRMPPWAPAPGYGTFANDIGLTQRELTMLLTWTDGGLPRGDDRDLPRDVSTAAPSAGSSPDYRLSLPAHQLAAGEDSVRRVIVDAGAAAGRFVRHVRVAPGNVRVLRAAFVFIATSSGSSGQWIGAWTPWQRDIMPEGDLAFRLPAGAKLLVELHYRGGDNDAEDRSSIDLFFAPQRATAVGEIMVEAGAPIDGGTRMAGVKKVTQDVEVWAIVPRVPELWNGAGGPAVFHDRPAAPSLSLEVTVRRPNGSAEVLLWIPKYRGDWPAPYITRQPVRLPAGTTVRLVATGESPSMAQDAAAPSLAVSLSTAR